MSDHILRPLHSQLKNFAAISDREGAFPHREFELLKNAGLMQMPLAREPFHFQRSRNTWLLDVLTTIGSASLPVGRIYEGHVNALQLIDLFGNQAQKDLYFDQVFKSQSLFGVWNTQDSEGLKLNATGDGKFRLEGFKNFCSGAGAVEYPLITGELINSKNTGWQMCVVPAEKMKQVSIDYSSWKPLGMRASVSYKVNFTGIVLDQADLIGPPGAYYQQPYFSAGAVRFAAVQLGAAKAILNETHQFLRENNRTGDAFQKARTAEIACLVETGNLWISRAAVLYDSWTSSPEQKEKLVAYVNLTRTVVSEVCLKTLELAERSVGLRALMQPHPLELIHRDLSTYIKQPGPDAALTSAGNFVLEQGDLSQLWH